MTFDAGTPPSCQVMNPHLCLRGHGTLGTVQGVSMYVPKAREKVRLLGRREVFFVLAVNLEECSADMIPLDGMTHVEHGVPFALIELYEERSARRGMKEFTLTQ